MEIKSRRQNGRGGGISSLNSAIDALELARDAASVEPVKEAFRSAVSLLATIKVGSPKPMLMDRTFTDVLRRNRRVNRTASNWG